MSPARPRPGLDLETELASSGARFVAGMDEVGRGALAGPASVGVVVLDVPRLLAGSGHDAAAPDLAPVSVPAWDGVRDSKALSAARRAVLAPRVATWAAGTAVGHAQPHEIDALGITAALRLAGLRALAAVTSGGTPVDALILDGSHNWLEAPAVLGQEEDPVALPPVVRTLVKADARCVSVAAASIVAKVERDALMVELGQEHPAYEWGANKGYGSAAHRAALVTHGTTRHHRRSWNLGVS